MSENITTTSKNTILEDKTTTTAAPSLTIEWVLTQIQKIIDDKAHINDALNVLKTYKPKEKDEPSYGSVTIEKEPGAAWAEAIADVVKCRETTNQQTLTLLERMYDQVKPYNPHNRMKEDNIEWIKEFVNSHYDELGHDELLDMVHHIMEQ